LAAWVALTSHCPDKEQEAILRRLLKFDKVVDRRAREPRRLQAILGETRRRNYGVRDPSIVGGFMQPRPKMTVWQPRHCRSCIAVACTLFVRRRKT
jgi:hypothetical protein